MPTEDRTAPADGDERRRAGERSPTDESGATAGGSMTPADGSGASTGGTRQSTDGSEALADGTRTAADGPYTLDDVAVVMGAYNEEDAVGAVLDDVAAATEGRAEVVVVDGSDDRTPAIARDRGTTVIEQPPRGYGVAVRAALSAPDRPVVVTTDCDDTYPMDAIPAFLAAVNDGADVVSGDRLARGAAAMPWLNRQGNRAFALLASVLAGRRVHDVTTGMRAYRREVVHAIEWTENTGLSAELLLRPLLRGYDVRELPIDYAERAGESKLDPLSGGAAIAASILRVAAEERRRQLVGGG